MRRTPAVSAPVSLPDWQGVFLAALPFAVLAGVALIDVLAGPGVGFVPMLSLGPALAAISRPLLPTALIGMLALAGGVLLASYDDLAGSRRERELADFKAIADVTQQILPRPAPRTIPPVDIAVRYVSAAASARIGGDLYEVVAVGDSIRLIVGDVLGKGLPASRTAAVVLGAFRESAYDAGDLTLETRAVSLIPLKHGDRLLFYTDGITEARGRQGAFCPLEGSGDLLGLPDLGSSVDRLIEDVLHHVGHALQHDAAILLIGW